MRTLCCVLLVASLALSGCWDRHETDELALETALAVDWSAGQYTVTAETINTRMVTPAGQGSGGGMPGQTSLLKVGRASDLAEALIRVQSASSRLLFWQSTRVLLIGEGLARHGIAPLLDVLAREPRLGLRMRPVVTRGEAAGMLATGFQGLDLTTGRYLFRAMETMHAEQGRIPLERSWDLLREEAEAGRAPLLPAGSIVSPPLKGAPPFRLEGAGVFWQDRLVAWLPPRSMEATLWLNGQFVRGSFELPCPSRPDALGRFRIYRAMHRVRPIFDQGRLVRLDVNLSGQALLSKAPCGGPSLDALDRAAAARVREEVQRAIAWAQGSRYDIFGWGEEVYRLAPTLWQERYAADWRDAFGRLPVRLRVQVTLRETGFIKT